MTMAMMLPMMILMMIMKTLLTTIPLVHRLEQMINLNTPALLTDQLMCIPPDPLDNAQAV